MSDELNVQEAPQSVNAPVVEKQKKVDASVEAQNKVAALREQARAKVNELLRGERGVPEPETPAEKRIAAKDAVKEPIIAAKESGSQFDVAKFQQEIQAQAEKSLKARQEAESLLAQAKQKEQELQESVSKPLEFLEKAGYTPDEWQALLLAGGKESAEMKKAKEAEARAKRAEEAALKAAEELKQYQRNVLKAQAIKEIEPQLAQFPLTSKLVSSEQLLEMIQKHYRETGQKLSVEDAAKTLEATYEKQFEELLADEKVAKKVVKGKVAAREQQAEAGPTTLSNRVASTTTAKTKLTTLEERREAAMRLLRDRGVI